MKLSMMALLAGAGLLVASPASAQEDPWMGQVAAQLGAVVQAVAAQGMSPAADPVAGSLAMGAADEVELALQPGQYLVVGVCDTDCSDLDLVLTGTDGAELASDLEMDDTPVVTVTLTEAATLTLEVKMAACTSAPCRYGIGLYTVN